MVPVINELKAGDFYDYILVVVRRIQIPDLLPALAKNVSPNVVFMSNNFSGPGDFIKVIKKERVMMSFVFGSGKLEDGII
jgi:ketopantoate reductase